MSISRIEFQGCVSPNTIGSAKVYPLDEVQKHIVDPENIEHLLGVLGEGLIISLDKSEHWSYPAKLKHALASSFDGVHTNILAEVYDWVTKATESGADLISIRFA